MLRVMKVVTAVLVGCIIALPVWAQPIWLAQSPTDGNSLAVEFIKPNFEGEDNLTFLTSVWFFSGRFAIGESITLVGELPLVYAKPDVDGADSETIIGNPYGGIEVRRAGSNFFGELGVRLPVTPDDKFLAPLIGFYGDVDRLEAFIPDLFGIIGRVNYQSISPSNIIVRLRVGPTILTNSDDFFEDDTEVLVDYNAQVGYSGQSIIIVGGFTGRYIATQDEGDFGEKTIHQLGASAGLKGGTVSPGVHFRLPLDEDLTELLDFVFGLNLTINLQ